MCSKKGVPCQDMPRGGVGTQVSRSTGNRCGAQKVSDVAYEFIVRASTRGEKKWDVLLSKTGHRRIPGHRAPKSEGKEMRYVLKKKGGGVRVAARIGGKNNSHIILARPLCSKPGQQKGGEDMGGGART